MWFNKYMFCSTNAWSIIWSSTQHNKEYVNAWKKEENMWKSKAYTSLVESIG